MIRQAVQTVEYFVKIAMHAAVEGKAPWVMTKTNIGQNSSRDRIAQNLHSIFNFHLGKSSYMYMFVC